MKIMKSYQFRMYPNDKQRTLIHKTLGCTRLVYNIMLSKKKNNEYLTKFDLMKEIPSLHEEYSFLKEVDSMSLRSAIVDLCHGFDKYHNKQGNMPKYKRKEDKNSYRTTCMRSTYKNKSYENISIDLKNKTITLPKLKEVKIRGYRHLEKINGRILNATIKKEANKYYVVVCVEEEKEETTPIVETVVGIDAIVKHLVVTSNNEYYDNPKVQNKYDKKIKGLQKSLARKVKGSKNYYKTKMKIEEVYRKLRNARKKMIEEIISKVTKYNDMIVTEKLKVKEMLSKDKNNKYLRKEITNATFSNILKRLEYKCLLENKVFYQVNSYYASSRICSRCGEKQDEMKDISIREYKCSKCSLEIERDLNASINIMTEGVFRYYQEKLNS